MSGSKPGERRGGLRPNKKGGERRGGRAKGTPNRTTRSAREAIEYAFNESGGAEALATWARANRTEFYTRLFVRLLPLPVHMGGELTVHEQTSARDTLKRQFMAVLFPEGMPVDADATPAAGTVEGDTGGLH